MALNLLAMAGLAVAIVAAFALFRRLAPRDPAGGANACLRCGTPAAALDSFNCPGCGQDVRETGLGPARRRSALALFWTLVVYTSVYLVAAMIAGNVLFNVLPRVHTVSRNTSMRVSSPEIHGVEIYFEGRGPDPNGVGGTVTGEMYGAAGAVILEVDRPPRRWRLLDLSGKELAAGEPLDGATVYRWMELAGAPTDTPVAHSDAAHIAGGLSTMVGAKLPVPPIAGAGRPLALSYSSATGGGSMSEIDRRWPPLIIMGAAALWLAGVWLVLRQGRGPVGRAAHADAVPVSPRVEAGPTPGGAAP